MTRHLLTTALTLLSLALPASLAQRSYAQSFQPILPLSTQVSVLPLRELGSRDPIVVGEVPTSQTTARSLSEKLTVLSNQFEKSKGEQRQALARDIFETSLKVVYFGRNVMAGIERGDQDDARSQVRDAYRYLVTSGAHLARSKTSPNAKARIQFHLALADFFSAGPATGDLSMIKRVAKNPHLVASLKEKLQFIIAVNELSPGSKTGNRARGRLIGVLPRLDRYSGISARLALSRYYAGIDFSGRKVSKTNSVYKRYLKAASTQAGSLPDALRSKVFAFTVGIWLQDSNPTGTIAFSLRSFEGVEGSLAVVERAALKKAIARNYGGALKSYQSLRRSYSSSPYSTKLDQRILDLAYLQFQTSKNAIAYQNTLISMQQGATESGKESLTKLIAGRHKQLIDQEILRAKSPRVSPRQRRSTIGLVSRFIKTMPKGSSLENKYTLEIGNIYAINKQHRKAVVVYLGLADKNKENPVPYLNLAIKEQEILAKWPSSPSWNSAKPGPRNERITLVRIYKQKLLVNPHNWTDVAQAGLLDIHLGRSNTAFNLWKKQLIESKQLHPIANQIAGIMIDHYNKKKDWQNLEVISRTSISNGIRPIQNNRGLDAKLYLSIALYEGGKKLLVSNQFAEAETKLSDFVAKFPRSRRHAHGYFLLASALRGNNKHHQAIETLIGFTTKYPNTKWTKTAYLMGGDWSVEMAYEETTMSFYDKFQRRYRNDQATPRVREALNSIYLGRQLYGQASSLMREILADKRTKQERKNQILQRLLFVEENHGSEARAISIANEILSRRSSTAEMKAMALGTKARSASRNGDLAGVNKIHSQLNKLSDSGDNQISDILGEVRMILAESHYKKYHKEFEVDNLTLKNPTQTLVNFYARWKEVAKHFRSVCQAEGTTHCAPALLRLAKISGNYISKVEDITINETLPEKEVNQFNIKKDSLITALSNAIQMSQAGAEERIKSKGTKPAYNRAVLWENSTNWNFEGEVSQTGSGFIQL